MSLLRALGLALALAVGASGVHADQTDPRLPALFVKLKRTTDAGEGARITKAIWKIWFESKNPAVTALVRRGQGHLRARRLGPAGELFNHVVKIAPGYAEGWNRRATVRFLIGDLKGSLADIRETLKREPRHFGALSGRGLVYSKMGRDRAALKSFEAALAINPHLAAARQNIRILRKKLGEKAI